MAEEVQVDRRGNVLTDDVELLGGFPGEFIADGTEGSPPPCTTSIASSASIAPAIGASRIGNSILNRSVVRRSGHMVPPSVRQAQRAAARSAVTELRRPDRICSASSVIR